MPAPSRKGGGFVRTSQLPKTCSATITPISSLLWAKSMPAPTSLPRPVYEVPNSEVLLRVLPSHPPPRTAPVWGPRGCQGVGSPHGFSEVQTPSHSRGFGFVHEKDFLGNAYTETGQQEVTGLEY